MYIGLWSRLEDFERDQLTRALERRTVIQATLMRVTIHLVSRADYWPIALAVREPRREWWQRSHGGTLDGHDADQAVRTIAAQLKDGPRSRRELVEELGSAAFGGAGLWLDLVRVPPSGTWERRRADLYGLAEDWVGAPPAGTAARDGLRLLVERYLRGFGPAAPKDVANWIGAKVRPVSAILDELELRHFRDEDGGLLVDLPRRPLPAEGTAAPVRFLPTWDSTLLVHARATGVLREDDRSKIFNTKMPQSLPTFLVDGTVAGTWRYEKGNVKLSPFGRLSRDARAELRAEGDRLAAFHSA
jgi:hypothetical protein